MARKISYQQAINEALAQEMRRDSTVFIIGEDVAGGAGAPVRTMPGAVCSASPRASTISFLAACWTRPCRKSVTWALPSAPRPKACGRCAN